MLLNYMEIHQLSDLKIIINNSVLITGSLVLKDEETAINMWRFSFDDKVFESLSQEQFESFVIALVDKKKQQIAEMYNSFPSTFYMWFDEMANQFRFNLLSGHTVQLPFGCSLEIVDSIEPIWQEWKELQYHEELSWSEVEFFEEDEDEDEEEYILKVYVQKI